MAQSIVHSPQSRLPLRRCRGPLPADVQTLQTGLASLDSAEARAPSLILPA
jgi:hypothetical protein